MTAADERLPPFHGPGHPEDYGLALLTEEIGEIMSLFCEVLQSVGKAGRFGLNTPTKQLTLSQREKLQSELGDLFAAVDYLEVRGVIEADAVHAARAAKLRKLLDPNSVDNLGRRLAP